MIKTNFDRLNAITECTKRGKIIWWKEYQEVGFFTGMEVTLNLHLYPRCQDDPTSDWILKICDVKENTVEIGGAAYLEEMRALVEAVQYQRKNKVLVELDRGLERRAKM